jgi:hypothetical protein
MISLKEHLGKAWSQATSIAELKIKMDIFIFTPVKTPPPLPPPLLQKPTTKMHIITFKESSLTGRNVSNRKSAIRRYQ